MLIIERDPGGSIASCRFHWNRSENSKQRSLRIGGFNLGVNACPEHGKTTADYKSESGKCAHADGSEEVQPRIREAQVAAD